MVVTVDIVYGSVVYAELRSVRIFVAFVVMPQEYAVVVYFESNVFSFSRYFPRLHRKTVGRSGVVGEYHF